MAGLLAFAAASAAGPVCHIHPPVADAAAPSPPIVGPYESAAACEQANALMYAGQGRCHCAFDGGVSGIRAPRPSVPGSPEDPAFDTPLIR